MINTQGITPSTPLETIAVRLTELDVGDCARLQATQLVGQEREWLSALGLDDNSCLRLCKVGNPCIIQVSGTRIGLSEEVARKILVMPEEPPR